MLVASDEGLGLNVNIPPISDWNPMNDGYLKGLDSYNGTNLDTVD